MAQENNQHEDVVRQKKGAIQGAPAWMVTYSDLVTLLLTFFVLLVSMANLDPVRFTEASSSIRDAFGFNTSPAQVEFAIPVTPSPPDSTFSPLQKEMTLKQFQKLKTQIMTNKLTQDIEVVQKDGHTLILRIGEKLLFEANSTTIAPQAYPLLRFIADIIRPLPLTLRFEGHADSISDSPKEIDQWNISMDRAASVMRFYVKGNYLLIDRMAAAGYGGSNPLSNAGTAGGQEQNRRVDFVLHSLSSSQLEKKGSSGKTIPF